MSVMAGWREVWTGTHGVARRFHVSTADETAACRPGPDLVKGKIIPLTLLTDAAEVPKDQRCRRNGCRQRWP